MVIMEPNERLYLSRKRDIYIDTPNITQQQIDGIRFIFRQFIKEKRGIILNDPSTSDVIVEIALFLNAIRPHLELLSYSVLVLCRQDAVNSWLQCFIEWTEFGDTVYEECSYHIRSDMLICINPSKNIPQFASRQWSIVIIDDNEVKPDILRVKFKAAFKMWITSINMKENLSLYSKLCSWLDIADGFDENEFNKVGMKVKDHITRSLIMDALMQDVVLRRKGIVAPGRDMEPSSSSNTQPKVSRKNKDITGKKIKRSKKPIDTVPSSCSNDTPNIVVNIDKITERQMDVETFINTEKPIEFEVKDIEMAKDVKDSASDVKTNETAIQFSEAPLISNNDFNKDTDLPDSVKEDSNVIDSVAQPKPAVDEFDRSNENNQVDEGISNLRKSPVNDDGAMSEKIQGKRNKFDISMEEMEEKSMKKFKGTLLDSIF